MADIRANFVMTFGDNFWICRRYLQSRQKSRPIERHNYTLITLMHLTLLPGRIAQCLEAIS
jgi:hypothetical protein